MEKLVAHSTQYFILLFLSSAFLLAGTTRKIWGTITDEKTDAPIVSMSVILAGTTIGTASDEECGRYRSHHDDRSGGDQRALHGRRDVDGDTLCAESVSPPGPATRISYRDANRSLGSVADSIEAACKFAPQRIVRRRDQCSDHSKKQE
jgi:hypothetical protein